MDIYDIIYAIYVYLYTYYILIMNSIYIVFTPDIYLYTILSDNYM